MARELRRLSFDIFLQRFRSGEPISLDPARFWEALAGVYRGRPGGYTVVTGDGGECAMQVDAGENGSVVVGCAFFIREQWTPQLLTTFLNVARATDGVLVGAFVPPRVILVDAGQRSSLPEMPGWDDPVVCQSGEELAALLGAGFMEWDRYRTQMQEAKEDGLNRYHS